MVNQEQLTLTNQQLNTEFEWLEKLIRLRTQELIKRKRSHVVEEFKPVPLSLTFIPELSSEAKDFYSIYGIKYQWKIEDRIMVLLAISSLMRPDLLHQLILFCQKRKELDFTLRFKSSLQEEVPTYQLVLWLLFGSNAQEWSQHLSTIHLEHTLLKNKILKEDILESSSNGSINPLDIPLILHEEFLVPLTTGLPYEPRFSTSFPANKVKTDYQREDIILEPATDRQLSEAIIWMKHLNKISSDKTLRNESKGYKAIFYGPPGTGKSMAAKIIGKELDKTVYRIDLTKIVSKYVGETEKNLKQVFDMAERRDWILFFDEGDALFGKRGNTKSSQDRYANQEVAYLLQRMEEYPGIILLASNKKNNLDEAFIRRFHTMIYFNKPSEEIRLSLWQKAFSGEFKLEDSSILATYAQKYEVSGAEIINIKHFAIVSMLEKKQSLITEEDLRRGLELELNKKGHSL